MFEAYVWFHVPPSQLLEKIPYSAAEPPAGGRQVRSGQTTCWSRSGSRRSRALVADSAAVAAAVPPELVAGTARAPEEVADGHVLTQSGPTFQTITPLSPVGPLELAGPKFWSAGSCCTSGPTSVPSTITVLRFMPRSAHVGRIDQHAGGEVADPLLGVRLDVVL